MTTCTVRYVSVAAAVAFAIACSERTPTAPTAAPPTATAANTPRPEPPPQGFPPVSRPARIYQFNEATYRVQPYTRDSRYVLYDDGAFALQYLNLGEYRGTYSDANGVVTFNWEGWSSAGPWGATGVLNGEVLSVTYNLIMMLTDFEDAVYLQTH